MPRYTCESEITFRLRTGWKSIPLILLVKHDLHLPTVTISAVAVPRYDFVSPVLTQHSQRHASTPMTSQMPRGDGNDHASAVPPPPPLRNVSPRKVNRRGQTKSRPRPRSRWSDAICGGTADRKSVTVGLVQHTGILGGIGRKIKHRMSSELMVRNHKVAMSGKDTSRWQKNADQTLAQELKRDRGELRAIQEVIRGLIISEGCLVLYSCSNIKLYRVWI